MEAAPVNLSATGNSPLQRLQIDIPERNPHTLSFNLKANKTLGDTLGGVVIHGHADEAAIQHVHVRIAAGDDVNFVPIGGFDDRTDVFGTGDGGEQRILPLPFARDDNLAGVGDVAALAGKAAAFPQRASLVAGEVVLVALQVPLEYAPPRAAPAGGVAGVPSAFGGRTGA